jgi:glutaredoxin
MRALCEKHKLAVGADGKCVVCRRPFGGALGVQPEPIESILSKVVTSLLLLGLLAAVGALAYLSTLPEPYSGPKYMDAVPPNEDTSLATIRPEVLPAEPERPVRTATAPDGGAAPAVEPAAAAAAEPVAKVEPPARLDPKARYAARATVPVTLFTSDWCFLCDQARDYLIVRGVAVQSVDIDADKAAYERLLKFNKAASLPSFEVAGKSIIGFNPTELEATIDAAAVTRP